MRCIICQQEPDPDCEHTSCPQEVTRAEVWGGALDGMVIEFCRPGDCACGDPDCQYYELTVVDARPVDEDV